MNGATFDITIQANSIGVDSSVAQLNAFAAKIQQVDTVATAFDGAVAAASKALENASAAAQLAAEGLGAAEKSYRELESAANKSAQAVEKASAAGKDTKELVAAAEKAKAAMSKQGEAVDELRKKYDEAVAAQKQLTGTLGTLKGKQSDATKEIKKGSDAQEGANDNSALTISSYIQIAKAAYGAAKAVFDAAKSGVAFILSLNPTAMARVSRMTQRLDIGFKNLFRGLQTDKLLGALEDMGTLFDKGTSSANGMKTIVETIFQPLIDLAVKAEPLVKEMFKGMIHGALLLVIAVLKIRNAILAAMSPETRAWIKETAAKIFTLHNAFILGTVIVIAFAVAIGILALAVFTLTVILSIPLILIGLLIYELYKLWEAIKGIDVTGPLKDAWKSFVDWLKGLWDKTIGAALDFGANLAANIIAGLTGGLAQGSPQVKGAMTDVMASAKSAAAKALDSHSPSKVYEKLGATVPAGFAQGVANGEQNVKGALESMASPSDMTGAAGGGDSTSTTTSKSSRSVHIEHLTIGDSPVAKATFDEFKKTLLEVIEGENLSIGGGEAPAAA